MTVMNNKFLSLTAPKGANVQGYLSHLQAQTKRSRRRRNRSAEKILNDVEENDQFVVENLEDDTTNRKSMTKLPTIELTRVGMPAESSESNRSNSSFNSHKSGLSMQSFASARNYVAQEDRGDSGLNNYIKKHPLTTTLEQ